jgi:alkylation response protein AidB-like acyl-CoA dehydrogenase
VHNVTTLLDPTAPKPLPLPRTPASLGAELHRMASAGDLDLPLPGGGRTADRWAALAALGRTDLALARLAEGHVDALAILAEAGRPAVPDALYGVWAARSGGTGAALTRGDEGLRLTGTVRFCSGANLLDRALVAASPPGEDGTAGWLVEIDVRDSAVLRDPDSWAAIGMDASDSIDVRFADLPVTPGMVVGEPGWYVGRRGFPLGGGGVAAVWLGGAAGVLDSVLTQLREAPKVDEHQLAHLGALHTTLRSTEAMLATTALDVDADPGLDPTMLAATCRAAAERTAWDVLDRVPRITGPTPLCRDRRFAQQLADLQVYVRQHHAERDLAGLGRDVLSQERQR